MSEISGAISLFERFLWPDRVAISGAERAMAAIRIQNAQVSTVITDTQAEFRIRQLSAAQTRRDLNRALDHLPGAPPAVLLIALRIVSALWLAVSAVTFVVWVMICLFTRNLETPWFLWAAGSGAVIVAVLGLSVELAYRNDTSGEEG